MDILSDARQRPNYDSHSLTVTEQLIRSYRLIGWIFGKLCDLKTRHFWWICVQKNWIEFRFEKENWIHVKMGLHHPEPTPATQLNDLFCLLNIHNNCCYWLSLQVFSCGQLSINGKLSNVWNSHQACFNIIDNDPSNTVYLQPCTFQLVFLTVIKERKCTYFLAEKSFVRLKTEVRGIHSDKEVYFWGCLILNVNS